MIGKLVLAVAMLGICSCSGTHSTITEGFAFEMQDTAAEQLVQDVIKSNIVNDRMLTTHGLVASGYDRSLTDTQTYTLTAVPVPRLSAFGFELRHEGTMFNGPSKAKRIYQQTLTRAGLVGKRVNLQ